MTGDFWDKFSHDEDAPSQPKTKKRHRRIYVGGIAALFILSLGSVGALGLFPFQYKETPVAATAPAQEAEIATVEGTDSPALVAVTQILKDQFTDTNNLSHAAVGEEQIARTLPGQNGCTAISPVASGLQGYSGGSWRDPVGITITVNAYGPGLGALALQQLTEDCKGVSAESNGAGTVTGDIQGSRFQAWHQGDVVVSITGTNTDIPSGLVTQVRDRVTENLKTSCAAPATDGVLLSSRNPYYDRGAFTGLVTSEEVTADNPREKMDQPDIEPLPDVTRPTPPAFPYYPSSLPDAVSKPDVPAVPEYPATTQSISYQVEDATGPGCGWAFTNTSSPNFDAEAAEQDHQKKIKDAKQVMEDAFTRYDADVDDWTKKWVDFESKEQVYRDYATQVSGIADQWSTQKTAQDTYTRDNRAYNKAVGQREQFYQDQRTAQEEYDSDVQTCKDLATTPPPTQTPSPSSPPAASDGGGESPSATPSPTPTESATPSMQCPPDRPDILDESAPSVPTKPTPPADPRPEEER